MELSFQNTDNFIRNAVTIKCGGQSFKADIRRLTESSELCVSSDDVMLDLRVDDPDAERATVERYIRTACGFLERRTCAVCLRGEFEVPLAGWWQGPLELRRFPFRELVGIDYLSGPNTWTAADVSQFWVDELSSSFVIQPLRTFTSPALWSELNRVRLRFAAGFDDVNASGSGVSGDDKPCLEPWRGLITALVGHYMENRELMQADKIADVEMSAGSLLASVRQFW